MVLPFMPPPALAPYVSCFLVKTGAFESETELIFSARGIPMLVFPFKAPSQTTYVYGESGGGYTNPQMDKAALLVATDEYAIAKFVGEINFVMVMLQTTAAYHFLQSNLRGLAGSAIVLDDLDGQHPFKDLQDQLWSISDPAQAVGLIQKALINHLDHKAKPNMGDLSPVMNYMLRQPGQLTVQDLGKKFKCSERWLEKQFAAQTGLSPKAWLRLIRFRTVANFWLSHPEVSWMHMVAKFDYTDQSHLIKDFKHFTGNPPAYHFEHFKDAELDFKQNEVGLSGLLGG